MLYINIGSFYIFYSKGRNESRFNGKFILYQTRGILLVHRSTNLVKDKIYIYIYVNNKNFNRFSARCQKMIENKDKSLQCACS